jgi:hypothetical protein
VVLASVKIVCRKICGACPAMRSPGPARIAGGRMGLATSDGGLVRLPVSRSVRRRRDKLANRQGEKIMSDKIVTIEEQEGPFQMAFQRVLRMVPDRDKHDKKLQRLIAFRLRIDGEAAISEYLMKKIRETIKCSYSGSLYDYLKDDLLEKECGESVVNDTPPGAA